ncbi:hypothetical protein H6G33_07050 [Calothrix sp. FACHB-1219]|uniref:hypothetical protein n=1 Tax=unclassified Calothrix TaxID=2619626 RepID=UPI0016820271|nr:MULTISPECIES: hypothetical protein [unclassified Calothrix]MBD2204703.1 hypothetical protein [Calothrix sp. FACHB-168]MBD2216785.1 hypothetical protein [Calothrix sp. FACHB-1219]
MSRKRKPVGYRLDEVVIDALKTLARNENTSVNRYIETHFFKLAKEKGLISNDTELLGETRGGDTSNKEEN